MIKYLGLGALTNVQQQNAETPVERHKKTSQWQTANGADGDDDDGGDGWLQQRWRHIGKYSDKQPK